MVFSLRNTSTALIAVALIFGAATVARADGPTQFDLQGPKLTVTVTRDGATLPIAEVPNLAVGDQISVRADLPEQQSAHYVMVAAFLRGSTNPPPEHWFFRTETWRSSDGLNLIVPDGAQQVLVFLAPETGGDFHTLINAVRGKPGAFVRASQDLNQAALDRSRLDTFLADVKQIQSQNPAQLKQDAALLGRSLSIKIDDKCFDRVTEEQGPCLMHDPDAIILNDGHSESIVQALTSGSAGDLATQMSLTPQAGYGVYSPYVQSVMDIARILDSLHTAQYQYIPALASLKGDEISLRLNVPPSFHNPKSVLVAALPAVEEPQPPPLRAADPNENYCVAKSQLALAVEGAPLVFSTAYAHDTVLHVTGKSGKSVDVPVKADAIKGGLVVEPGALQKAGLTGATKAQLHGEWGFAKYDGPEFDLITHATPHWQLAQGTHQTLIVGKDDIIHLTAGDAGCVEEVSLEVPQLDGPEKRVNAQWKAVKSNDVEVTLPLQGVRAGDFSLNVKQFGGQVQSFPLKAFADEAHIAEFNIHAGDAQGVLRGSHLDQVARLEMRGIEFSPSGAVDHAPGQPETLNMEVKGARAAKAAAAFKPGDAVGADVSLSNGSEQHLDVTVGGTRPVAELLSKTMEGEAAGGAIRLTNSDELPQTATLTFSVRLQRAANPRNATIEVATEDQSASTILSASKGTLTPENHNVMVARLEPAKAFGESAFGPLKFRVIEEDTAGEWTPLATLVRLPQLSKLDCPTDAQQPCTLDGSNLFLMDAVASDSSFAHAVEVPDGFTADQLQVPHPAAGGLLVKLRDDPSVVNQVTLAVAHDNSPHDDSSAPATVPTATSAPVETRQDAAAPMAVAAQAEKPTPAEKPAASSGPTWNLPPAGMPVAITPSANSPASAAEVKPDTTETPAPAPVADSAPAATADSAPATTPTTPEKSAANSSTPNWNLPSAGMPVAITPATVTRTAIEPVAMTPVAVQPTTMNSTDIAPVRMTRTAIQPTAMMPAMIVPVTTLPAVARTTTIVPRDTPAPIPEPSEQPTAASAPVIQPAPVAAPAVAAAPVEKPAPVETPAVAADPEEKAVPVETPAIAAAPEEKPVPVETPAVAEVPVAKPTPVETPAVAAAPVEKPASVETPAVAEAPVEKPAPVETPAVAEAPVEKPAPVETPAIAAAPEEKPAPVETPAVAAAPVEKPAPVETPAVAAAPVEKAAPVETPAIAATPEEKAAPVETPALTAAPVEKPAPVETPAVAAAPEEKAVPVETPAIAATPEEKPAPVETPAVAAAPVEKSAPVEMPAVAAAPEKPAPVETPAIAAAPAEKPAPVETPAVAAAPVEKPAPVETSAVAAAPVEKPAPAETPTVAAAPVEKPPVETPAVAAVPVEKPAPVAIAPVITVEPESPADQPLPSESSAALAAPVAASEPAEVPPPALLAAPEAMDTPAPAPASAVRVAASAKATVPPATPLVLLPPEDSQAPDAAQQ